MKPDPPLRRIHPSTRVTQVALTVHSLQRELDFYTKVLGLDVVDQDPGSLRFGARDEAFLQLVEDPRARRPEGAVGLYHFAILYPTRADLASVVRKLLNLEYPLQGASDHFVSEAVYLEDPEGNGIEVYRDRLRPEWPMEGREVRMGRDPLDLRGLLREAADPARWITPEGTRIGHVHLHVHEIGVAERFYAELLGFDVMQRRGGSATFLSAGGYHHHIGINTWGTLGAPLAPEGSLGLRWYRIEVPEPADLEQIKATLEESDYPHETEDGVLLVRDPSQHQIRVRSSGSR